MSARKSRAAAIPRSRQGKTGSVQVQRVFPRFTLGQRLEHAVLSLSFIVLLLTGLPQKYYDLWGHYVLPSPQSIQLVRQVHHIAAVILILEVIYHLAHNLILLVRGRLSGAIFPNPKDFRDIWQMLKYLLFLTDEKPKYGKYNFEQKFTYWFLVTGIGVMVITGIILWFPIQWTRIFPGSTIPAAQFAHSSEAIVATIFLVIWHFYHVLVQRLNLSMFTGRLNEQQMREYHALEYERLTGEPAEPPPARGEFLAEGEVD